MLTNNERLHQRVALNQLYALGTNHAKQTGCPCILQAVERDVLLLYVETDDLDEEIFLLTMMLDIKSKLKQLVRGE